MHKSSPNASRRPFTRAPVKVGPNEALKSGTLVAARTEAGAVVLHRIETYPRRSPSGIPGVDRVRYGARRISIAADGSLNASVMKFSLDARNIIATDEDARTAVRLAALEKPSEK